MPDRLGGMRISVFTKQIVILGLAGFSIACLILVGVKTIGAGLLLDHARGSLHAYIDYVIKDLGDHPVMADAEKITAQTKIAIRYEGDGRSWTTSPSVPSSAELTGRVKWLDPDRRFGFAEYRNTHCLLVNKPHGRFVFTFRPEIKLGAQRIILTGIMITLFVLILVFTYFGLHRVMLPVKWLHEGVQAVIEGDMNHRVRVRPGDELGTLADAFNRMTDRIKRALEAREQLLLDISHELRSPLSRMRLAVALMPESELRTDLHADILEMEDMVTEILEAARIHAEDINAESRPVDLADILKQTAERHRRQPPGIRLAEMPEAMYVRADVSRLRIVFDNILSNALKFSTADSRAVEISLQQGSDEIVVVIRDDGMGIPEKDLPFVLEPFYRADKARSRKTGGYGLGLSLVQKIMTSLNGRISIRNNTPAAGVTVSLHFPETSS